MAGDILQIPIQGEAYIVKRGDFLRSISLQAYGEEMSWRRIWDANSYLQEREFSARQKGLYPNKEDLIHPGDILYIPPLVPKIEAGADNGELTADPAQVIMQLRGKKEFNFLPSGAPIIDAEVTLGDQKLDCIQGQFTYGMDTFASCWMVTVPWTPGLDAEFDRNSARSSFAPSEIRLNGELKGTGYLYSRTIRASVSGITKQLVFFNKTKDLLDTYLITSDVPVANQTLKSYVENTCGNVGYTVVCQSDNGRQFPPLRRFEGAKVGQVMQNLASQRGMFVCCGAKGEVVLWKFGSNKQDKVASLFYGGDTVIEWATTYDDSKRFYEVYLHLNIADGTSISASAYDNEIPAKNRIRRLETNAAYVDNDSAKLAAEWTILKTYLQSMEIQIPVKDWLDDKGNVWQHNSLVMLQAPVLEIPTPRLFIIRTVDFTWGAKEGRQCTLHLVPAVDVKDGKIIY
ncbi:MAG: hypothetical protein Pg6A_15730 [Termitinemataceae bacterium]|nr:MAG: hypothetical protein Pg6A_15730 [Termitinemataceae bacterium]